jgi:hypothetical protein
MDGKVGMDGKETIMAPRIITGAALATIMAVAVASAQERPLELVNATPNDLNGAFAAPAGSGQWGDDLLGGGFLPSGNRASVTVGSGTCIVDLRFVLSDGDEIEELALDICAAGSYTLSD